MDTGTSAVLHVTDQNFAAEIEQANGLSVVDFGADWCGPCRMVAPIVEQLAQAYQGKVKIGKIDVDANQETSSRFGVRNLPTFLFFKDGVVVDRVIGAVPRGMLERKLQEHL